MENPNQILIHIIHKSGQLDPDLALTSYFKDPEWTIKTGLGGLINAGSIVLLSFSTLFLPVVLVLLGLTCGYMLRTIKYKLLNVENQLPNWDDWLDLFMSGLTWLAIQFGLSLIQISILTISLIFASAIGSIKIAHPLFIPWFGITAVILAIISGLLSFLNPYLMVNFAIEEKVQAGFAFRKVLLRAKSNPRNFILAWLLSIGIIWAAVLVPAATIIGIFFLPSILFMGHVLCATFYAQAWGQEVNQRSK